MREPAVGSLWIGGGVPRTAQAARRWGWACRTFALGAVLAALAGALHVDFPLHEDVCQTLVVVPRVVGPEARQRVLTWCATWAAASAVAQVVVVVPPADIARWTELSVPAEVELSVVGSINDPGIRPTLEDVLAWKEGRAGPDRPTTILLINPAVEQVGPEHLHSLVARLRLHRASVVCAYLHGGLPELELQRVGRRAPTDRSKPSDGSGLPQVNPMLLLSIPARALIGSGRVAVEIELHGDAGAQFADEAALKAWLEPWDPPGDPSHSRSGAHVRRLSDRSLVIEVPSGSGALRECVGGAPDAHLAVGPVHWMRARVKWPDNGLIVCEDTAWYSDQPPRVLTIRTAPVTAPLWAPVRDAQARNQLHGAWTLLAAMKGDPAGAGMRVWVPGTAEPEPGVEELLRYDAVIVDGSHVVESDASGAGLSSKLADAIVAYAKGGGFVLLAACDPSAWLGDERAIGLNRILEALQCGRLDPVRGAPRRRVAVYVDDTTSFFPEVVAGPATLGCLPFVLLGGDTLVPTPTPESVEQVLQWFGQRPEDDGRTDLSIQALSRHGLGATALWNPELVTALSRTWLGSTAFVSRQAVERVASDLRHPAIELLFQGAPASQDREEGAATGSGRRTGSVARGNSPAGLAGVEQWLLARGAEVGTRVAGWERLAILDHFLYLQQDAGRRTGGGADERWVGLAVTDAEDPGSQGIEVWEPKKGRGLLLLRDSRSRAQGLHVLELPSAAGPLPRPKRAGEDSPLEVLLSGGVGRLERLIGVPLAQRVQSKRWQVEQRVLEYVSRIPDAKRLDTVAALVRESLFTSISPALVPSPGAALRAFVRDADGKAQLAWSSVPGGPCAGRVVALFVDLDLEERLWRRRTLPQPACVDWSLPDLVEKADPPRWTSVRAQVTRRTHDVRVRLTQWELAGVPPLAVRGQGKPITGRVEWRALRLEDAPGQLAKFADSPWAGASPNAAGEFSIGTLPGSAEARQLPVWIHIRDQARRWAVCAPCGVQGESAGEDRSPAVSPTAQFVGGLLELAALQTARIDFTPDLKTLAVSRPDGQERGPVVRLGGSAECRGTSILPGMTVCSLGETLQTAPSEGLEVTVAGDQTSPLRTYRVPVPPPGWAQEASVPLIDSLRVDGRPRLEELVADTLVQQSWPEAGAVRVSSQGDARRGDTAHWVAMRGVGAFDAASTSGSELGAFVERAVLLRARTPSHRRWFLVAITFLGACALCKQRVLASLRSGA